MRFWSFLLGLGLIGGLFWPVSVSAASAVNRYAGRIIQTPGNPSEYWYVDPRSKQRVPATTLADLDQIMRRRTVSMTMANIKNIPRAGTTTVGDMKLRRQMAGRFIKVSDGTNRVWYVTPRQKRRVAIKRDARWTDFLKAQAIPISAVDWAAIATTPNIKYNRVTVTTRNGSFVVDKLTFAWTDPHLKINTDTASVSDCKDNCPVLSLGEYVRRRNAVAGIHGTYFCPQDYSWCAGKRNSFYIPVYNSFTKVTINGTKIKFTSDPIVVIATDNQPYFYPAGIDLYSLARFTVHTGKTAQAMFSNGPGLVANGKIILKSNQMDTKQATVKGSRGAFGWKGGTIYMFTVQRATVTDLAAVAAAMDLDYAINLDGGGSTALYNDGRYILGPGRNLPNAIVITTR